MYVSDARTPMPSLYTKALPCLSDYNIEGVNYVKIHTISSS